MARRNLDSRSKATAKNGKPCRAAATAGGLCFFHANPNKASELGRLGGRRNRHATSQASEPLPALDTVAAVQKAIGQLINQVLSGKLSPRMASGVASLLNSQLRAIDIGKRAQQTEQRMYRTLEWGKLPHWTDPVSPPPDRKAPKRDSL